MVADSARLWHRRFMHVSAPALRRLGHIIPELAAECNFSDCNACLQGGARKIPTFVQPRRPRKYNSFGKNEFTYFGQRIASDLCGPFPKGNHGELYAIVFHDSYSKYIALYALPDKSKETVLTAFQQFLSDHSDRLSQGVGHFWTDNGGEYLNKNVGPTDCKFHQSELQMGFVYVQRTARDQHGLVINTWISQRILHTQITLTPACTFTRHVTDSTDCRHTTHTVDTLRQSKRMHAAQRCESVKG